MCKCSIVYVLCARALWQDSVRRSMDTSVRESERLQQELEQLTHGVHEKRAETDALKHEWLALRDECTQLRQQRDRYAKYIKCAALLFVPLFLSVSSPLLSSSLLCSTRLCLIFAFIFDLLERFVRS